MATLRDRVLPIISRRGWAKVQALGFSPYTATVRMRRWSGGQVKLGSPEITDLTLSPNPQVEERNGDRELRLYGIVPSHAGGGYTPAQLNPTASGDSESYWVIVGPDNVARNYKLHAIDTSDPVEYVVILTALNRAVPF